MTIVVSYQPDFIPILKELKGIEIVTTHAQFTSMLNNIDVSAKNLSDFITPEIVETSKNIAAFELLEYFQYQFKGELGAEQHKWLLYNLPGYLYTRISDIALIWLALTRIEPNLIIVHNDIEPLNRALALWARMHNVKCLHIPHAIYLEHSGRGAVGTDVHDLVTASHIAVSGIQQANWYIERGANPDQVYLTGLPQMDKFTTYTRSKEDACKLLGQTITRPVVTYYSSWRQDTNLLGCHDGVEESYNEFLACAKNMPELQYIVKCHPRGNNLEWHRKLAQEAGVRCIVLQDHIEHVIAASDLLISYGASNVVLEAAAKGYVRVAILGDTGALPSDSEINKIKTGELELAIKQLLSANVPDYNPLLRKYFYTLDGKNYLRLAKLIQELHG